MYYVINLALPVATASTVYITDVMVSSSIGKLTYLERAGSVSAYQVKCYYWLFENQ
jgi:hypothetical protein